MAIYETLQSTGLPCVYSHFRGDTPITPPYLSYYGTGQDTFKADNTIYYKENSYRIEFYFIAKDESLEESIETALLTAGYIYEKSDDVYIESEGVYVIYYTI